QLALTSVTNDQRQYAEQTGGGDRTNIGALTDTGEVTSCKGTNYGATVWFRWVAPASGTATLSASRFSTAIAIYQGAATTPMSCDVADSSHALSSSLSQYVTPGEYFIQVGGKDEGTYFAQDNFSYSLSFAEDKDLDKDHYDRQPDG